MKRNHRIKHMEAFASAASQYLDEKDLNSLMDCAALCFQTINMIPDEVQKRMIDMIR